MAKTAAKSAKLRTVSRGRSFPLTQVSREDDAQGNELGWDLLQGLNALGDGMCWNWSERLHLMERFSHRYVLLSRQTSVSCDYSTMQLALAE